MKIVNSNPEIAHKLIANLGQVVRVLCSCASGLSFTIDAELHLCASSENTFWVLLPGAAKNEIYFTLDAVRCVHDCPANVDQPKFGISLR